MEGVTIEITDELVVDVDSGEMLEEVNDEREDQAIFDVAFSKDGNLLAIAKSNLDDGGGGARLLDVASSLSGGGSKAITNVGGRDDWVLAIAFSPIERRLVTVGGEVVEDLERVTGSMHLWGVSNSINTDGVKEVAQELVPGQILLMRPSAVTAACWQPRESHSMRKLARRAFGICLKSPAQAIWKR